jgi:thermitase
MRWNAPLLSLSLSLSLSLTLALGAGAHAPDPVRSPAPPSPLAAVVVDGHEALAGRLVVRLREDSGAIRSTDRATLADLPQLTTFAATRGLRASEPLIRAELDEVARQSGFDRVLIVDLDPAADLRRERELWQARPEVEAVDYDWIVRAQLVPNDQYFSGQWALRNLGTGGFTNDCDIDAELAWDLTTGSSTVKIAIIDTGVRLTHADLSAKIVPGYDYVNNDATASDDNGHGTACASLAAASTNNTSGMAGVDWNARIMPLKALNAAGSGSTTAIINCVNWARTNGAHVISMSLGGGGYVSDFNTAINNAYNAGIVVVCATGNDNQSSISYPAAYTNSFAVGALSPCNQRKSPTSCDGEGWWGSNYGTGMDLLSPGVLLRSAWNTNNTSYISDMNGTSGATPIVAGVAALMRGVNPGLTAQQIYDILNETADNLGAAGWDSQTGWGRLNAYAAVSTAAGGNCGSELEPPVITHTPLGNTEVDNAPYPVTATVTDNCTVASVTLRHRVNGGSWSSASMTLSAGVYTGSIPAQAFGSGINYEIVALDQNSNLASTSATFYVLNPCNLDVAGPAVTLLAPLGDTSSEIDPVDVLALVTDPCGVSEVQIAYVVDGAPVQFEDALPVGGDQFAGQIPPQPFGSVVDVTLYAYDASLQFNESLLEFSYEVLDPCATDATQPEAALTTPFPATLETGQTAQAAATASDPCGIQGAVLTCSLNGGPAQSGAAVEGTPGTFQLVLPAQAAPGALAWTLVVTDASPAHNTRTLTGSLTVTQASTLPAPVVSISLLSSTQAQVSWSLVVGATGYRVEAAPSPDGPWTVLFDGFTTSWIVPMGTNQMELLRVVAHN